MTTQTKLFPALPVLKLSDSEQATLVDEITNASTSGSDVPLGYCFLGQFLAHDHFLTTTTGRSDLSTALDLDSCYMGGPETSKFLYDKESEKGFERFLLGTRIGTADGSRHWHDLPRNSQGRAIAGDFRNAENTIVAQLHVLFLVYHNHLVDTGMTFFEARTATTHAFQRTIIDMLSRICRSDYDYFQSRNFRSSSLDAAVSSIGHHKGLVEFTTAVLRYGHVQVPSIVQINDTQEIGVFDGSFEPAMHFVDWDWFFEIQGQKQRPQMCHSIGPAISRAMKDMKPEPEGGRNIAQRNIARAAMRGMSSFGHVADALGLLHTAEGIEDPYSLPLWVGMLKEGKENHGRLGPVGTTLLSGCIWHQMWSDPTSCLRMDPLNSANGPETPGEMVAEVRR